MDSEWDCVRVLNRLLDWPAVALHTGKGVGIYFYFRKASTHTCTSFTLGTAQPGSLRHRLQHE